MKRLIVCSMLGLLGLNLQAEAQVCSVGHTRAQRPLVLEQEGYPTQILSRMAELAELSASGVFSQTQRYALDNEFQAWKAELDRFGAEPRANATERTEVFLDEVIDVQYLGLKPARIRGDSIEESQRLSREALDSVHTASIVLRECLAGSWDRVPLVGQSNSGDCAGGYNRRDILVVGRQVRRALSILGDLSAIARDSAVGIFSANQRTVRQYGFEFAREELELLGERFVPGVSPRTRRFLRTLIDPIFLDIASARVDGSTIEESQRNARDAVLLLRSARWTAVQCVGSFH